MQLHTLTPGLSVSPQVMPADMDAIKAAGFRSLICNRPDGEGNDQPLFTEIEQAAAAVGIGAHYLPAESGKLSDAQGWQFGALLASLPGPVLAYCRTGMRSTTLWALSQADRLPLAAITMRMMRASLAETFEEDFVRTARGKGLSPGRVMRRHAIPAASAPVISLVGVTMGTVITNAILLEYTFSIPGMFSLMTQALGNADLPVIQGVAIAGALLVVTANLVADFVHAWLDPRVRTA